VLQTTPPPGSCALASRTGTTPKSVRASHPPPHIPFEPTRLFPVHTPPAVIARTPLSSPPPWPQPAKKEKCTVLLTYGSVLAETVDGTVMCVNAVRRGLEGNVMYNACRAHGAVDSCCQDCDSDNCLSSDGCHT
jgi:hypothetical protein